MIRRRPPAGAADSEYGCACHHSPAPQEPPLQELAAGDRQPVQPPPTQRDRIGARALGLHRLDRDAVAHRAPGRERDTERDDERERRDPQRRPPGPCPRDARRTRRPCRPGARRRGTARGTCRGAPPTTSRAPCRRRASRYDVTPAAISSANADGRGQDPGVGPQELAELVQHAVVGGLRVADGDQDRMGAQQIQRPRPELAMPAHEPVLADRALERPAAGDEHDHDDHPVRGGEPGEPAERGREPARGAQRSGALGRDPERERDAEPEPGERGQPVDDPRPRARGQAATNAAHPHERPRRDGRGHAGDERGHAAGRGRRGGASGDAARAGARSGAVAPRRGGRCRSLVGRRHAPRGSVRRGGIVGSPAGPQRSPAHASSSASGKPGVLSTVPSARIVIAS